MIMHNSDVEDTSIKSQIALAEARTRWNAPMPKVGEKFNINVGGCQVEAEWRGEFSTKNGETFWVLQYGESCYVKPKMNFAAYLKGEKSVKLAPTEKVQQ